MPVVVHGVGLAIANGQYALAFSLDIIQHQNTHVRTQAFSVCKTFVEGAVDLLLGPSDFMWSRITARIGLHDFTVQTCCALPRFVRYS